MGELDLSNLPFDLVINILNIVVFYIIIRLLVYKPVKKFLNARKEKLAAEHEAIADEKTALAKKRSEYDEFISGSEEKTREMLRISRENADKTAEHIVDEARIEAAKIIADANANIASKEREAVNYMKDDVVELAVSIASKLISRNIDDEDNKKIAADFFEKESDRIGHR